eukprot:2772812-Amphidinium_carterae.1
MEFREERLWSKPLRGISFGDLHLLSRHRWRRRPWRKRHSLPRQTIRHFDTIEIHRPMEILRQVDG